MKKYIKPETIMQELFIEDGILGLSREDKVVTTEEYSNKKGWDSESWTEE